ncbi:Uncharacterised protein [Mycobacterium tuberculosis]|uniref:Uncharacterized protein n=1 Tax=Mycobacterium tuberculosis TaxID=1773 RepID=A0A655ITP5_MYCTX|nr:Uncharacterised protein [Mycobacterium tuberculosis]CKS33029.1 Uncharacterised protein [Mycobacterium tuberculosis]CKT00919.1 Uncharacterised protein [Mycobacterium tuberculosis]CKT07508.1 Uncharacterised protein [Mycobacterium tuberculosis]CKV99139.1 Uncharacterised protein [Mycobacterium tuberculosis]
MIWLGTINAAMITKNTAVRPGNRTNTKPKALSTPSVNFTTASTDVMISELRRNVQNGICSVAVR